MTSGVGQLSEEILMWWINRMHRPPPAAIEAVVAVGSVFAEVWEAMEMAVSLSHVPTKCSDVCYLKYHTTIITISQHHPIIAMGKHCTVYS